MQIRESPSKSVPFSSAKSARSASPSNEIPQSALRRTTSRRMAPVSRAPYPKLILRPFGEQPSAKTSAPKLLKSSGAMR